MVNAGGAEQLEVLLFSHDFEYATAAIAAGMNGIVVDWEWVGKAERQRGRDTEITRGTEAILSAMRKRFTGRLICRIENQPDRRIAEALRAAELGADEIWLPMVRSRSEVEDCLEALGGRCELGIVCETALALTLAEEWAQLPLSRTYLGLNDLMIDTGGTNLFSPLCDGRVDAFRASYRGAFAMAGVTHPDLGSPIPCRLLLGEMARNACSFAVTRRSFRADVPIDGIGAALRAIRDCYAALRGRDERSVAADREEMCARVAQLAASAGPALMT